MQSIAKINEQKAKKELLEEAKKRINLSNQRGKYSFFENPYAKKLLRGIYNNCDYEQMHSIFDIISTWDNACNLSIETGNYVEQLCNQPDRVVAIHRSNIGELSNENGVLINSNVLEILQRGLQNLGHSNVGANIGIPHPSLTVTPLADFTGFVNLFASYKNNNITVLLSFPKQYVADDCSFNNINQADYIYNYVNNIPFIKPEYIEAIIYKNNDGFDLCYKKDEILEILRNKAPLH